MFRMAEERYEWGTSVLRFLLSFEHHGAPHTQKHAVSIRTHGVSALSLALHKNKYLMHEEAGTLHHSNTNDCANELMCLAYGPLSSAHVNTMVTRASVVV